MTRCNIREVPPPPSSPLLSRPSRLWRAIPLKVIIRPHIMSASSRSNAHQSLFLSLSRQLHLSLSPHAIHLASGTMTSRSHVKLAKATRMMSRELSLLVNMRGLPAELPACNSPPAHSPLPEPLWQPCDMVDKISANTDILS